MAIARETILRLADDQETEMLGREQEERERLNQKLQNAYSLADVQEATLLLKDWAARHPEEQGRLSSVFEQLFLAEESACEAIAEARALGLSASEAEQRNHVFVLRRRVRAEELPATFVPALNAAREALEAWQAICPSDPQLSYLQEALASEQEMHMLFCQAA